MAAFAGKKAPDVEDEDAQSVASWAEIEFESLAYQFSNETEFNVQYVLPKKPVTGLTVYADGTYWNPGSGEGLYVYLSTGVWSFLGPTTASGGKNKIINGGFTINQRVYVSAAVLAAAVYGHDRWKGGASGGTYTFAQLASPTTITISASKSLIQVVEDKDVEGGSYTLSWTGTATGRVTINSAVPAGNFAVSPITVSGQTPGTTMSVEFTGANAVGTSAVATNPGTLGVVQLESGSAATTFEFRRFTLELIACQRYYATMGFAMEFPVTSASDYGISANFPVTMRATPTLVATDIISTNLGAPTSLSCVGVVTQSYEYRKRASATGSGALIASITAEAEL